MTDAVEESAMRKMYMRLLPIRHADLLPLLTSTGSMSSFAGADHARRSRTCRPPHFGFAAGTFYWGYFIFEVPSNVIMEKVGARLWIARIMITWGILPAATALGHRLDKLRGDPLPAGRRRSRLLPGHVLYFTYWFPHYHHARIVSGFLIGLPIAVAAGAPISTAMLGLDGVLGLHGWQLMYLARRHPDGPDRHRRAVRPDRQAGAGEIPDRRGEEPGSPRSLPRSARRRKRCKTFSMWQAMFNPKVLLLSLNYFGIVTASLGMLIFVPQIIKSLGVISNMTVGWLTMMPYHLRRHRPGRLGHGCPTG